MPAPPIGGAAAGGDTAMGQALAGGLQPPGAGMDQQTQGLEVLMGQIRDIGQSIQALQTDYPDLAPDCQMIMTKLKEMVVRTAKSAPQQTASGAAVPAV